MNARILRKLMPLNRIYVHYINQGETSFSSTIEDCLFIWGKMLAFSIRCRINLMPMYGPIPQRTQIFTIETCLLMFDYPLCLNE